MGQVSDESPRAVEIMKADAAVVSTRRGLDFDFQRPPRIPNARRISPPLIFCVPSQMPQPYYHLQSRNQIFEDLMGSSGQIDRPCASLIPGRSHRTKQILGTKCKAVIHFCETNAAGSNVICT